MPMLQSVGCVQALCYREVPAQNFVTHKRRYGAGVSTSGSQPENPGSIPGTATKFFALLRTHLKKNTLVRILFRPRAIWYLYPHA
jgi:hypothetical protein